MFRRIYLMEAGGRAGVISGHSEGRRNRNASEELTPVVADVLAVCRKEEVRHLSRGRSMTIKWGQMNGMRGF